MLRRFNGQSHEKKQQIVELIEQITEKEGIPQTDDLNITAFFEKVQKNVQKQPNFILQHKFQNGNLNSVYYLN